MTQGGTADSFPAPHAGPISSSLRSLQPLSLARCPTPVEHAYALSRPEAELWLKRDDRTHEVYGGNKVRKLEWLLAEARARGADRIVTVGAAGSHHVLATTYFGRRQGFRVEAILVPQPRTEHVVDVLRTGIALGLHAIPVSTLAAAVPMVLWRIVGRGARVRFVALGGSSWIGAMGYVIAARELAAQVRAGEMPEPDVCVVALGSGGTAAGLAVGFEAERMKTRVVGVCVSGPSWALQIGARRLARACAKRIALGRDAAHPQRLSIDARYLGMGYGHRVPEGIEAARLASTVGITLDSTYTEKSFASALWHVRARRGRIILFWHTLSSAPMHLLLPEGPLPDRRLGEAAISPSLRRLLL